MTRKGLIRWNFLGHLLILALGLGLYLWLGLDTHIRKNLETKLTALNGGDVTIKAASFAWKGPRLHLEGIAFKDPLRPDRVRLVIGQADFQLEWPALLRNRIVVDDALARDIYLPPLPEPLTETAKGASLLPNSPTQSLAIASDYLSKPDRGRIPEESAWQTVPSVGAAQALDAEIDARVMQWKQQLEGVTADLRQSDDNIPPEQDTPNHVELTLSQLEKSRGELDQIAVQVKDDGNALLQKIESLSEIAAHDMNVIRQGVKLPSTEFPHLTSELGTLDARSALGLVDDFALRLLPWLQQREQRLQASLGREQGVEFYFTGRKLPPRLWVKKLEFVSKEAADGSTSAVQGQITDLNSEPDKRPAYGKILGSFGRAEIEGLDLEARIDHRGGRVVDRLQVAVQSFPVRDLDFIRTPGLRVGVVQADANLNLEYYGQKEAALINLRHTMEKVSYRVEADSPGVKRIFENTLAPLTTLQFDASAQGRLPQPRWNFSSNMSDRVKSGLRQVLTQEYAELFARIKERADSGVGGAKKKLEGKLAEAIDAIQKTIASENDKLTSLQQEYSRRQSDLEKTRAL